VGYCNSFKNWLDLAQEGRLYQYHKENTHLYDSSQNSRLQISVLSVKILLESECARLRTR
jgi:hypothetical protein